MSAHRNSAGCLSGVSSPRPALDIRLSFRAWNNRNTRLHHSKRALPESEENISSGRRSRVRSFQSRYLYGLYYINVSSSIELRGHLDLGSDSRTRQRRRQRIFLSLFIRRTRRGTERSPRTEWRLLINSGEIEANSITVKKERVLAISRDSVQSMVRDPAVKRRGNLMWTRAGRLVDPYEELWVKESKIIDRGMLDKHYTEDYSDWRCTVRDESTVSAPNTQHATADSLADKGFPYWDKEWRQQRGRPGTWGSR
ncbi:uncharacterized protein STEHIDRAFT_112894 [Stereum hirsutum FP-91666 SS1]|uniref:uncharacterized protein n=1 Tax=Stereum hirsutum (strain FP-91666) TaxID=721885 RepID=UPI000444A840|nr:uncharacterized protein STEHIDRAFT_112894 [Stereum hirsutum FP-91666 SS1]EIM84549.1 hypothetical protein STEHIDRAFT_112894 [Stereum hirsutum FP-91666 SS1]